MTRQVKVYWLNSIASFITSVMFAYSWRVTGTPKRVVLTIVALAFFAAFRTLTASWLRRKSASQKLVEQR
jgi:uncharacterized membrane protein